jgi:prophage regulatory protein
MTDPRDMLWQAIQLISQARKEMKVYQPLTEERIREIVADEITKAMYRPPKDDDDVPAKIEPPAVLQGDGLIRVAELAPLLAVAPATLWRWVKDGEFPPPMKIGRSTTAWNKGDVREWLAQRGKPKKGKR